ncbi:hypothetical protein POM88_051505 [Heracleum sosnowskyi]|uniref:ABC transporter domain-containing protein n=1 Tax=Heracleum sosnowskyi TaxID=360622 RepID=A0AAD8M3H2_9APIA|nr:hypothetical protein POM88_051505 [Heracleum sosnowskyi]
MDGSNLYNLSNSIRNSTSRREGLGSLRASSSSRWTKSGKEVFNTSGRDEDDEEALKWASLEKLPTFDRLRKGLLFGSQGAGASEVDVYDLGYKERKKILDRLLNVADEDNEKLLLALRERVDRVGIDLPQIEVRFENLKVETEAHVGSRALPSLINFSLSKGEAMLETFRLLPNRKKRLTILEDVSGIIKPCRMTLLLGPPSSGKTTLLLALAGKLDPALEFSGRVTYNGHRMDEFVPQRTAAYISQYDLHIGEMTVRETLEFSARCQGVGSRYEMLAELSRREKDANIKPDPDLDIFMKAVATKGQETNVVTEYVLKVLGLDICADTMVGDQMIRGISGGQRKRVTTGEMLVGPARALFMDEISTGLDSPRENVLEFFETMGFKCPERKGVADFLQEVTSKKDQKQYWYGISNRELFKAQVAREILLIKRNSFVYIFKTFQLTTLALICMTLFLRTELDHDTAAVWTSLTYYVIGYDPNVGRFVKQFILYFLVNQMASGLFRLMASLGRNMILAMNFGGFSVLILFALGGFVLARDDVAKMWIWGYYSSPIMYAMNAVTVNEFLGHQWSKLTENKTETIGVAVLKSRGFFPYSYWYWIGAGALIGFILLFNLLVTMALSYLDPLGKPQPLIPETVDTDEATELSTREINAEASQSKKKGMVLPFEPYSITFDDIRYSVDMPQEMKEQGVDEDKLLLLKAWLRLPTEIDSQTRKMFVEEVLELVEVNNIRNALVGLPGVNGLSIEQHTGRTVVCTIHQPSIDIFEAFDELFLLKRGGQEIYVGPVGRHSCELIKYFEDIDGISKIKDGYNPATWMLEVTSPAQEMALGIDFFETYRNSDLYRRNKALIAELSVPPPGLSLGSMFWDLGSKMHSKIDLFNAMGSMYAACLFLGVQNSASAQPVVDVERTVYYRERAAGMYSAVAYAFAQVLAEIPYVLTQTLLYSLIVYSMIGFEWTVAKFSWYVFFTFFTLLYFVYFGMMTVAVTPNADIAAVIAAAFYGLWNLFSGFLIPRPAMPDWWKWVSWVCPVAWTLYGLIASQFGDIDDKTLDDAQQTVKEFIDDYFGFKHDHVGLAAFAVVAVAVLFALIFAYSIKSFNFQKR